MLFHFFFQVSKNFAKVKLHYVKEDGFRRKLVDLLGRNVKRVVGEKARRKAEEKHCEYNTLACLRRREGGKASGKKYIKLVQRLFYIPLTTRDDERVLTEPFTNSEPQNQGIHKIYVVQNRGLTEFEALKL